MTRFLGLFWRRSAPPSPTDLAVSAEANATPAQVALPLPDALAPDESVARFIFRDRDMYKGDNAGKPKPAAFKPELWQERWELSVCRKTGVEDGRVWEIARTCRTDKAALARADVGMSAVHERQLTGLAVPTEYPEHAVIVGWPDDTQKDAQLLHQQALARAAIGLLAPYVSNET